jgi:c-di-GMP-binding flagellar brake protein YcgR
MREKRRTERIKEKTQVTITPFDPCDLSAGSKIIHHMTKDISLGGIRIQSNIFIPINSMLKMELSLRAPTRLITAYGKVRWIKSFSKDELFEIGIEFVDTSQEIIRILKNHIEGST